MLQHPLQCIVHTRGQQCGIPRQSSVQATEFHSVGKLDSSLSTTPSYLLTWLVAYLLDDDRVITPIWDGDGRPPANIDDSIGAGLNLRHVSRFYSQVMPMARLGHVISCDLLVATRRLPWCCIVPINYPLQLGCW